MAKKGIILATMAGAAAGLYLLAKKHEADPDHVSVENNDQQPSQSSARRFVGVGAVETNGMAFYNRGGGVVRVGDMSIDELADFVDEHIDDNDTWTALEAISFWAYRNTDSGNRGSLYYELYLTLYFLEKEHARLRYITPDIQKARMSLTQVLNMLITEDFGSATRNRIWSGL